MMSTDTTKRNKRQKTSLLSSTTTTSVSKDSSSQPQTSLQQSLLWPKNKPELFDKKGKPIYFPEGLLHNLDQYVWDALAHIDPQLFNTKNKRKQVAIREALNIIGMGWVATNETPYRKAVGALFDEAVKIYERDDWKSMPKQTLPKITKIKVEDVEWISSKFYNSSIELEDGIIKIGCTNNKCIFSNQLMDSIKTSIDKTGMAVIPNAVDESTIQKLLTGETTGSSHPDATQIKEHPKVHKLLYTSGNGKEGRYNDIQGNTYLNRLQNVIVSSLKKEETITNTSDKRKYILLNYSEGGENWAHRDSIKDDDYFPYQGLLMLSNIEDYDGGEFYVAKRCDDDDTNGKKQCPSVIRTCSLKLDAGDLILFQASKEGEYDHGMKTVTRGERVAIGLLQPVPKKD